MRAHRLDALIAPTSGPPSLTDLVNGDYGPGGASSIPAIAGYPHITVPAGFAFGLPVGLSFFGRAWSEMTLIRIAYACTSRRPSTGGRRDFLRRLMSEARPASQRRTTVWTACRVIAW